MKKLLVLLGFTLVIGTSSVSAIPVLILGKGGLHITGEGTQICPEFALRKSAVLQVSLAELWDMIFAAGPNPEAEIEYYSQERGETVILNTHLKSISGDVTFDENNFEMPESIQGSKLVFE